LKLGSGAGDRVPILRLWPRDVVEIQKALAVVGDKETYWQATV
jgi:hypothetical protein